MRKKTPPKSKLVHAVIESIEEGIAIIETDDRTQYTVPKSQLPEACQTGHHLQIEVNDGKVISSTVDEEATAAARLNVDDIMARLRRGDHLKKRS